jgi:hypothetical protein
MQEQTFSRSRPITAPAAASPVGTSEERRAREEWQKQLDQMLDDYRSRYVLHIEPRAESLARTLLEGG